MTDTFFFLAQATEAASGAANPLETFFRSGMALPVAFIIMFYFLLIRPQQKQRKELEKKVAALKKGDKVITNGGIHGMINHKGDKTVSLKVSEGVFITIESSNIGTVVSGGEEEPAPSEKEEDKK